MANIRKEARARNEVVGPTEREFRLAVRRRMLQPLNPRDFTRDFVDRVRSRDQAKWNVRLDDADLTVSPSAPMRVARLLMRPFRILAVNLAPAFAQVDRQAQINEYHRRLLWATTRELELTRLQLDLLKRELRRLGIRTDIPLFRGGRRDDGRSRDRAPRGRGTSRGSPRTAFRNDGRRGGRREHYRPRGGRGARSGRGGRQRPGGNAKAPSGTASRAR